MTCPIALFNDRTVANQSQSQTQSQGPSEGCDDGKGCSKNTVKALAVIRRELQPSIAPSSTNGFPRMSQAPSVGPSRRQGSAAPSIASVFGL